MDTDDPEARTHTIGCILGWFVGEPEYEKELDESAPFFEAKWTGVGHRLGREDVEWAYLCDVPDGNQDLLPEQVQSLLKSFRPGVMLRV
jgi:hypothetical protein